MKQYVSTLATKFVFGLQNLFPYCLFCELKQRVYFIYLTFQICIKHGYLIVFFAIDRFSLRSEIHVNNNFALIKYFILFYKY